MDNDCKCKACHLGLILDVQNSAIHLCTKCNGYGYTIGSKHDNPIMNRLASVLQSIYYSKLYREYHYRLSKAEGES